MDQEDQSPKVSRRKFLKTGIALGVAASTKGCSQLRGTRIEEANSPLSRVLLQSFQPRKIVWTNGGREHSLTVPFVVLYNVLRDAGMENPEQIDFNAMLRFLEAPNNRTVIPVLNNAGEISGITPDVLAAEFRRRAERAGWRVEVRPLDNERESQDALETLNRTLQHWRDQDQPYLANETECDAISAHIENGRRQRDYLLSR